MTSREAEERMSEKVFGMSEEDFFVEPLLVSSEVGKRLIRVGSDGLRIDGPKNVELDRRTRFPVVAVRVAESMNASKWLFKEFAMISTMDLVSGTLHAEFFIEQKFVKMNRDLENNPPPPGKVAQAASADLFERLDLARDVSEYLVTVILLDQSSNRIRVKVGESRHLKNEAVFRQEIGKRTPEKISRIRVPGPKAQQGGMPRIAQMEIPKEPGILGRATLLPGAEGNGPDPWLQVAYRLPYSEGSPRGMNVGAGDGTVLVPVGLLATGTRVPAPWVRQLDHLGSRTQTVDGKAFLEGLFDVRLAELGGLEGNQVYFLYIFSGEWMAASIQLDLQKWIPRVE